MYGDRESIFDEEKSIAVMCVQFRMPLGFFPHPSRFLVSFLSHFIVRFLPERTPSAPDIDGLLNHGIRCGRQGSKGLLVGCLRIASRTYIIDRSWVGVEASVLDDSGRGPDGLFSTC
ncbi:hypothetical protein V2G26_015107 [Clonostachys chloroleuca]